MSEKARIIWDGGEVTAIVEGSGPVGVLVAHGAGTDQEHPSIAGIRRGLAAGGHTVLTFNYPYTQRGSKRPDPQDRLLACHRAAADRLSSNVEAVVLAGRSMGGRMGTYLVAEGYPALGLILYAYPLHPAGKPEKLRVSQFADISIPMLFFQGTRDALSRMELFEEHIASLPNAEVEILEGAGHGYRGGGWDMARITDRYVAGSLAWIERLSSGTSR
ncbi:MAG TPA: alpha/beta family hydrolase [Acidimicrobiia bacterium]|nr:alpha/beta family hydrolase [Acidimicrobiia bacterium]